MNKVKYIILTIISLLLYGYAPNQYDKIYCIACFIVFIAVVFSIIKDEFRRYGILTFNIVFFSSFFLCTYAFPVFLMGSDSVISELLMSFLGSYHTVTRAVSLSTFAISIYGLGYVLVRNKSGNINITKTERRFAKKISILAKIVLILLTIVLIVANWKYISIADGEPDLGGFEYVFALFFLSLPLYLVSSVLGDKNSANSRHALISFFKNNKVVFLLELLLILVFLLLGNRGPVIQIVFVVIATIILYVKRISYKILFFIGLVALLVMFTLRTTRQMDNVSASKGIAEAASNANTVWDLFSDLVGINFELNAGMQYVDENGYLYPGANLIRYFACPIPHLSTVLVNAFYGVEIETVSTEQVIKKYTQHSAGNHCVIDVYMCFGVIGVAIVFFLFGLLVANVTNGLAGNFFCKVFYIYLMGTSLYFPRSSLMYGYRNYVTLYFLILFLGIMYKTRYKHYDTGSVSDGISKQ